MPGMDPRGTACATDGGSLPRIRGMALMNMLQHCTADDFTCKRMERTRYHLW